MTASSGAGLSGTASSGTASSGTASSNIVTPTVRQASRKGLFWAVIAAVAVVVVVIVMLGTGAAQPAGEPLSATSAGPAGSKALAEVLRQQGVDVTAAGGIAEVEAATGNRESTTLFVVDDSDILDSEQWRTLRNSVSHIVVMTPTFGQLESLAPDVGQAGSVDGELTADCSVPAVVNADTVTGDGVGYRYLGDDQSAVQCLGSGDQVYSLVQFTSGSTLVSIVGTRAAFSNERVVESGNAAFALNLLGATDNLVWYLPGIDDAMVEGTPSIGELTPEWVSAVAALALLVTIAAGFWRGRRLGPLVVENLPVTVRASETMEGRARLYQRATARLRALDALRVGTISRLGSLCGLPRRATVDDVIAAVSAMTGHSIPEVSALLRDDVPTSDTALVSASDALLSLEREASATQPGRIVP